jgi:hypothetical protein
LIAAERQTKTDCKSPKPSFLPILGFRGQSDRPEPLEMAGPAECRPVMAAREGANSGYGDTSFDHLVGAGGQRRWNVQAERFGSSQVDDQLKFRRLLDGRSAGFAPLRILST